MILKNIGRNHKEIINSIVFYDSKDIKSIEIECNDDMQNTLYTIWISFGGHSNIYIYDYKTIEDASADVVNILDWISTKKKSIIVIDNNQLTLEEL